MTPWKKEPISLSSTKTLAVSGERGSEPELLLRWQWARWVPAVGSHISQVQASSADELSSQTSMVSATGDFIYPIVTHARLSPKS